MNRPKRVIPSLRGIPKWTWSRGKGSFRDSSQARNDTLELFSQDQALHSVRAILRWGKEIHFSLCLCVSVVNNKRVHHAARTQPESAKEISASGGRAASIFTLQEAESDLRAVLQRVQAGEEVVISDAGQALVVVSPAGEATRPREPGGAQGRVVVSDDFNAPLPDDVLGEFER